MWRCAGRRRDEAASAADDDQVLRARQAGAGAASEAQADARGLVDQGGADAFFAFVRADEDGCARATDEDVALGALREAAAGAADLELLAALFAEDDARRAGGDVDVEREVRERYVGEERARARAHHEAAFELEVDRAAGDAGMYVTGYRFATRTKYGSVPTRRSDWHWSSMN